MADMQRYKRDLERLTELGREIARKLAERDEGEGIAEELITEYQQWYTEASRVMKQVLPDRFDEFTKAYGQYFVYRLSDYPDSEDYDVHSFSSDLRVVKQYIKVQNDLLRSAQLVFASSLVDIAAVVQADLFDSELDAARELLGKRFLRAAGVIAGVVLERHLAQVAASHNLTIRKQNPTIGDFNELLKKERVVDVPAWRQIQRLGDLRNLCAHDREREPTEEEVDEIIEGADKYTKTLF